MSGTSAPRCPAKYGTNGELQPGPALGVLYRCSVRACGSVCVWRHSVQCVAPAWAACLHWLLSSAPHAGTHDGLCPTLSNTGAATLC